MTSDELSNQNTGIAYFHGYRFARKNAGRLLAVGMDVADVCQVALLGLHRAATTFDPTRRSFAGWANFLIRHEMIRLAETIYQQRHELPGGIEGLDGEGDGMDGLPGSAATPLELAERAELVSIVHAAIDRLKTKQREAVLDRMAGMTNAAAAARAGVSWEAIQQRHNAGRRNLRKILARYDGE